MSRRLKLERYQNVVLKNIAKQTVLLTSFHLNGRTLEFHLQTQTLEPNSTTGKYCLEAFIFHH